MKKKNINHCFITHQLGIVTVEEMIKNYGEKLKLEKYAVDCYNAIYNLDYSKCCEQYNAKMVGSIELINSAKMTVVNDLFRFLIDNNQHLNETDFKKWKDNSVIFISQNVLTKQNADDYDTFANLLNDLTHYIDFNRIL